MAMRRKVHLRYKKERVLFADVLPYELPLIFTNRNFYRIIVRYGIHIQDNTVCWNENTPKEILMLLELYIGIPIKDTISGKDGAKLEYHSTIPFVYNILHKPNKSRQLSVIHPIDQLKIVDFYEQYKNLILYYCNRSNFSIRYPHAVASYCYYKDRLHNDLLGKKSDPIELFFSEYENLKTFFSYEKYTNIYKFYEGYHYQRSEKKFSYLIKFDIQSCFDSIYTHSITWAMNGGPKVYKTTFLGSDNSFGEKWDKLMQNMNYGETHGIVVGPEFSRIFAEVILQFIDSRVELKLMQDGYTRKLHYDCFRYVDDHFLFYNDENVKKKVMTYFEEELKSFKMSISSSKTEELERPFITNISRAKIRIDELIKDYIRFEKYDTLSNDEQTEELESVELIDEETEISIKNVYERGIVERALSTRFKIPFLSTRFNVVYKAVLAECDVEPKDVLNYTLSRIANRLEKILKQHNKVMRVLCFSIKDESHNELHTQCKDKIEKLERNLSSYLTSLLDSVFFIYASNRRINSTLKIIQIVSLCVDYIASNYKTKDGVVNRFSNEIREVVYKKIHDEICTVLRAMPFDDTCQLETMYLLVLLRSLARRYQLSKNELYQYMKVEETETGEVILNAKGKHCLNALSIIILFYYCKNGTEYSKFKEALIKLVQQKLSAVPEKNRSRDAELVILVSDLITCPYIRKSDKEKFCRTMKLSRTKSEALVEFFKGSHYLFTRWTGVNLTKELNAKICQDVYS